MRTGVVTSSVVHVALLTWGLWSLGAPKALDAQFAEALPVEVIMSDTFEGVKGEKDAPLKDKPAPKPTTKPQTLPMDAKNTGDNEADLETPPVPDAKPSPVESKPQPKAADLPPPEKKPEPKPEPKVAEKTPPAPTPAPTPPQPPKPEPEKKPEPQKQPEPPKEDPLAEAIEKAENEVKPVEKPAPKPVPKPVVKPQPPKPEVPKTETAKEEKVETAKKMDSKAKDKPKKEVADKASEEGSDFNADEIMAQLNKAKPAGGGAKRSTETASLGSKVTTGTKLSRSQLGELQGMIQEQMSKCWNPPAGIESGDSLRVAIRVRFTPSGEVEGMPEITQGGGSGSQRIAAEAAVRAIRRCAPFNLPSEMYAGGWEVTNLNFDPSEMF
ncbi:hypothetical protein [Aureimonas psammosilenae]|uniref:hypothetical protein n=1 Tax=Aureimonas psammosilenae TaxID=2495496 RepID=UPI0012608936|nr:hypothetical protein [Aureimonas psammosilenae]